MRQVGAWMFDADGGTLVRGGEQRRLEPRAADTLRLLVEADGAVVSQERIVSDVWGGRSQSENSVSVVISQLRRALGDDARRPTVIETVPKRGYRLVKADAVPVPAKPRRFLPVALVALAAAAAGLWSVTGASSDRARVAVEDVVNATGNPALEPHARATSELIVTQLEHRGFDVVRGPRAGAPLRITARLVMWAGKPSLGLTATDPKTGVVRWSAMTKGGPAEVPAAVAPELDRFQRQFGAR